MGKDDRKKELLEILIQRGSETMDNLAFELNISTRTVRRYVEELSLNEAIYTKAGRYGGGVYLIRKPRKSFLSQSETLILEKLYQKAKLHQVCSLTRQELQLLRSIIDNLTKSTN